MYGGLKGYHEVLIKFNRRSGLCRGNSLGLALTIIFIQELLKVYNPTFLIQAIKGIAITGGLDDEGRLLPVGKETIKLKTDLVFFSNIEQFIVPKQDEIAARVKLNELKLKYPKRKLSISAVESLEDLLNRRNIVNINKINIIVRIAKYVRQNVLNFLFILLLSSFFNALLTFDLDDNPSFVTLDGKKAYIKNKNGTILFDIPFFLNSQEIDYVSTYEKFKIIDIDFDGDNEVIYIKNRFNEITLSMEKSAIICIDKDLNTIWSFSFLDTVSSDREILLPPYGFRLIDTATIDDKKVLLFVANNDASFSTVISGLELNNGMRIKNTFWGSGHTVSAITTDLNNDGRRDIVAVGFDNGFEDAVFFGLEANKLDGYRPSTKEYQINVHREADLIFYIRIPKQDIDKYFGLRMPIFWFN